MAVLVEAISVIMRVEAVMEAFSGDFEAFVEFVPNNTLCVDNEIARVGFMTPDDVESFIHKLENRGMRYLQDEKAIDIVVIDQLRGSAAACDWVEFGKIPWDDNDHVVSAARLVGSEQHTLMTPDGWEYENSLSASYGFVPSEHHDKSLKFLRHEGNLDVYLNMLTGKEVYVGRTGSL